MVYRCIETFETREGGYAVEVGEGTTWMRSVDSVAYGGYELVTLIGVTWRGPNGATATIRLDRLLSNFEPVGDDEIWHPGPPKEDA